MITSHTDFKRIIGGLTQPLNGQYPRPWMTDLVDPLSADVFVVGKNQAKGYGVDRLPHARHVDALFNCNGETCRGIYNEITGFNPSPTRQNTDRFRHILGSAGVTRVLETNVICYSTPMSSDLGLPQHQGGVVRGSEIFRTLMHHVKPKVLIAHGYGTRDTLGGLLGVKLPIPPTQNTTPQTFHHEDTSIFIIPSLAPPQWYQWHTWAPAYLARVAEATARAL